MLRRLAVPVLLLLSIVGSARAQDLENDSPPAAPAAITTVAELRSLTGAAFNDDRPLALKGIVTLADAERNLLVLQDDTGVIGVHPDPPGVTVRPGQRVELKAGACYPYVANCPAYPYHPNRHDIQPSLEMPEEQVEFHLTRLRGWLVAPKTGEYTFWISSDNSSELWLSSSADPTAARRLAFVKTGDWTDPKEWTRFSSQRSETIYLKEGEPRYIEVLQEQQTVQNHLAVAWEGPSLSRSIIGGRHLVPWQQERKDRPVMPDADAGQGLLRECWDGYSSPNLTEFTSGVSMYGLVTARGMKATVLEENVWPAPRALVASQRVEPQDVFRWVEGEGPVSFIASDGRSLVIEFGTDLGRLQARVDRWEGEVPRFRPNLRVKFRGVCEVGFGVNNQFVPGQIWVPTQQQVSFVEGVLGQGPLAPLPPPGPAPPALEGFYFTRGVVSFSDRVLGRDCLFVQEALGGVFVSIGDRKLGPTPQVGQSVEIGGGLLPGKHAPVLQPVAVNLRGWQNLPPPAMLFQEPGPPVYREGQWSEAVGVARAVNPDGTLILACRGGQIRVWIGRSTPADLAQRVNAVLRVRGVMSLGVFDAPVLLSPSLSHVELMDPAPPEPAAPAPVATLTSARPVEAGWIHQTRAQGRVTLQIDGGFYLQDETGGICVRPLGAVAPLQGARVLVTGYRDDSTSQPQLTEATWQELPQDAGPAALIPVQLGAENPPFRLNASLVTVTARLLSQKVRGAARVLELQTEGHVFEATLERGAEASLPVESGSTVKVTGIALLEPLSEARVAGESAGSLVKVLLPSAKDVVLLQGPPWWTWRRAVVLVGALLVVIVGTLWRISFLNRRFARQQQARLAFARELLESQESERRRIAASLHDSLGQNLLVIRNQVHMALQGDVDKPAVRQRLEAISDTTLQALEEVREITHNLRPYQLDRLGLTQAIRATVRKVSENCPVEFACHVEDVDGFFDKESEIHIYRIVQEGVNNIVKHSGATEATVVVKLVPGHLSISIRDNGSGLSPTRPATESGFGLTGVKERAQIMGGSTRIDTAPGQGFALHVELPLPTAPKCALP